MQDFDGHLPQVDVNFTLEGELWRRYAGVLPEIRRQAERLGALEGLYTCGDELLAALFPGDDDCAQVGESAVAERVVQMIVGVDHITDGLVGDFTDFLDQMLGLARRGQGIDDQHRIVTDYHPDVGPELVERRARGNADIGVDAIGEPGEFRRYGVLSDGPACQVSFCGGAIAAPPFF